MTHDLSFWKERDKRLVGKNFQRNWRKTELFVSAILAIRTWGIRSLTYNKKSGISDTVLGLVAQVYGN